MRAASFRSLLARNSSNTVVLWPPYTVATQGLKKISRLFGGASIGYLLGIPSSDCMLYLEHDIVWIMV